MTSLFVLASMMVLGATTVFGIFTNCLIVLVNLAEKAKGKKLNSIDLILVTLGTSNIIFQLVMTANDFMSLMWSDMYYSDEVYTMFNALLFLPVYTSFWFTVCLCVCYSLQIVIFTNPFLVRIKMEIPKRMPWFLLAVVFISIAISIPVLWSTYKDNSSEGVAYNQSLETEVPKLRLTYLLPSNMLGCSIPLVLVGVSNVLILKSLATSSKSLEKKNSTSLSPHIEAKERAARTVTWLLILYTIFYISEIMMFVDVFPPSSPGFCICLMMIYSYSPAQSVILILGSPKLKKAIQSLLQDPVCKRKKQSGPPNVIFIKLRIPNI
ncbi:taste receptor type 2 member 40-like [Gastrophryne carolinensis]